MPGSFDYTPQPPAISSLSVPIGVFRYDPDQSGEDRFQYRPNVFCELVEFKESSIPSACRCSYLLDILATSQGWPGSFEELFPLDSPPSQYAFANDDQVVVLASMPDGQPHCLFHGYAQAPQLDLEPRGQQVTFVGYGAAIRCWDNVIDFRRQRNNNALANDDSGEGTFVDILVPTHFNPQRQGNMIPTDAPKEVLGNDEESESDEGTNEYPIFTDDALWKYYKDAGTDQPALWTLSGFATYILAVYNDENDVTNPTFESLVGLLDSRVPINDLYDPKDPSTYTSSPITIPDFDASGMRWPEALSKMLEMHGFGMLFDVGLEEDESNPEDLLVRNNLVIYRRDQAGPYDPKEVFLPPPNTNVDEAYANVGAVHLAWDLASVRNAVSVEMAPEEAEYSFILAPNFQPVAGDEVPAVARDFLLSKLQQGTDANRKKYRQFVANDGNGRYWQYDLGDFTQGNPTTGDPTGFGAFYQPDPDEKVVYKTPEKVIAFAPTSKTLVSKDDRGQTRKSILEYWLPNHIGVDPGRNPDVMGARGKDSGLTEGSWKNIPDGWELLEDRIGVNFTIEDPRLLTVNKAGRKINLIKGSSPIDNISSQGIPALMFRLTTTVQLAERVPVNQGMRAASPTRFPRWMLVDRHDQYKTQQVSRQDFDILSTSDENAYPRDDYPDAKGEASAIRNRHEFPPLAGSITIPSLSLGYFVSDRISRIKGRDISLQCNAGTDDEAPTYPWVVSVTWNFNGANQTTTLQLSDRRLDGGYRKATVKQAAGAMGGFLGAMAASGGQMGGPGAHGGAPTQFGGGIVGARPLQVGAGLNDGGAAARSGGFTPTPGRGMPTGKGFTPTPGRGMPDESSMGGGIAG